MGWRYYCWLLAGLWGPALITVMFFVLLSAFQQILLNVEGFIEISNLLVTLTGLTIAILIGVYTAIYVQSRSKRESGFDAFFASLNDLSELTREVHFVLRDNLPDEPQFYDQWGEALESLLDRLHAVTPSWPGYETDAGLEAQILKYNGVFKKLCDSIGTDFYLTIYPMRHDRHLRGVLLGLLTMEEAIEGNSLSSRLSWILPSLAGLLALCGIGRIVAEFRPDGWGWFTADTINLSLTAGLSMALISHIIQSIGVIYYWQYQVGKRDREWETPIRSANGDGVTQQ